MEQNAAKIKYCNDLSSLGFGLDELIGLENTIVEITGARDSDSLDSNAINVVKQFFEQIEEFRNLEAKIESLKKKKMLLKRHVNCLLTIYGISLNSQKRI
jgi:hypothetical protein